MVELRDMAERDIRPSAELLHHIWHEFYAPFLPKSYAEKTRPPQVCRETQEKLLANCTEKPELHKTLVAVDADGGFLGYGYMKKYWPGTYPGQNEFDVDGYDSELVRLYLWPHAARKGTGLKFLRAFASWLSARGFRSCFAWAFDDNPAASFFPKNGAHPFRRMDYAYSGKPLPLTAYGWENFPEAFNA